MRPQLEARLREVHARGLRLDPDRVVYLGEDLWRRFCEAVACVVEQQPRFRLNTWYRNPKSRVYELIVTEAANPPLGAWIGERNDVRTAWLNAHGGTYPVLWLLVSRVWPAWEHTFNLWQKRGETGYLDANVAHVPPDPGWLEFMTALEEALRAAGIETLRWEERHERVPFVLTEVWSEDGDDDNSECVIGPDHEEAIVAQCLFDDYS